MELVAAVVIVLIVAAIVLGLEEDGCRRCHGADSQTQDPLDEIRAAADEAERQLYQAAREQRWS